MRPPASTIVSPADEVIGRPLMQPGLFGRPLPAPGRSDLQIDGRVEASFSERAHRVVIATLGLRTMPQTECCSFCYSHPAPYRRIDLVAPRTEVPVRRPFSNPRALGLPVADKPVGHEMIAGAREARVVQTVGLYPGSPHGPGVPGVPVSEEGRSED